MQPAVINARRLRAAYMRQVNFSLRPTSPGTRKKLIAKQSKPAPGQIIRHRIRDAIPPDTIDRLFEGGTAVLFATGPSLTDEVVEQVLAARKERKLYLFGCNDSYRIVPALDVHYSCDASWWRIHYKEMDSYPLSVGMWTQEPQLSKAEYPQLRRIAGRSGTGLSTAQDTIHFGNNSGYQLINLALLFGIKTFILCGYNMSVINKKRHFFGDHPQGLNRSGSYTGFVGNYNTIKPASYGIKIINATPQSALTGFPKMSLAEALKYAGV